jgi:endonuclease YncB( thermonuclease family)
VDGDTFYVSVRVVGADTPEIGTNAKCDKERAWGERASKRASELMRGTVTIQIKGVDRYDRLLARVILPDGRDLADVLISEKLALPYAGGTKPDWCQ